MPEAPFTWQRHAQAEQTTFRAMLQALSYPGRVVECPLAHGPAWLQALACLMDASTGLADVHQGLTPALWRQLGARPEAADGARFVLADAAQPPQCQPNLGTLESPEAGATVLLRCAALGEGQALHLSGPGIANSTWARVVGVHPQWWVARQRWNAHFPMGVDLLLADEHRLLALPRTTRVAERAPTEVALTEGSD